MLTHGRILVSLLWLVEQIPMLPPPVKRPRGRQEFYSDKLYVKALIVMIIRRLYMVLSQSCFFESFGVYKGIVKLTAERKNTFHSAGISAGSEALTSHLRR